MLPHKIERSALFAGSRRWLLLAVVAGVVTLCACGPYRSSSALKDVEALKATVSALEESGKTHRRAAYAIAKGDAFLRQARFSAGHADHTGSMEFAQIARESFMEARILLEGRTEVQEAEPAPQPPSPTSTEDANDPATDGGFNTKN